jgi:hypothetical protein
LGSKLDDFKSPSGQRLSDLSSIFLGDLHEIEDDIFSLQNIILLFPRSNPLRALCVQDLAKAKIERYEYSKQEDDIEQAILLFTEAIFLPLPWDTSPPIIAMMFYSLTLAIFSRARDFGQPRDVKCCVMYLRFLRERCYEYHVDLHMFVTEALVWAVAIRVELKLEDSDLDIQEIAGFCDEFLDSDVLVPSQIHPIVTFARAMYTHFESEIPSGGRVPSEKVIGCLRKAKKHLPGSHEVSIALARTLLIRFNKTPSEDVYKDGLACLDNIINSRVPGQTPSPYRERALRLAAMFSQVRFDAYGKPEHLEEAIHRLRAALDEISPENSDRHTIVANLSYLRGFRFSASDTMILEDAMFKSLPSDLSKLPSFQDLSASLSELNHITSPEKEMRIKKHSDALHLLTFLHLSDIGIIEDGVKYCRQLLTSCPHSQLAPIARFTLCNLFQSAFKCTN